MKKIDMHKESVSNSAKHEKIVNMNVSENTYSFLSVSELSSSSSTAAKLADGRDYFDSRLPSFPSIVFNESFKQHPMSSLSSKFKFLQICQHWCAHV